MLVRKSVSDRIGLFEADFFAHQEEIDFCWRAKNFGYRIMATSQGIAYHVGGGTLNRSSPKKTFLNARNNLVLLIRNLPTGKVLGTVWTRACLDGLWAMRSLLRGDFATIWAILKAHWAVWLRLGYWLKKRKEIYRELPAIPQTTTGYYPRSIVWQHFAKGVKKFSGLEGIKTSL
jgi:GT2 family glycosyltransferase